MCVCACVCVCARARVRVCVVVTTVGVRCEALSEILSEHGPWDVLGEKVLLKPFEPYSPKFSVVSTSDVVRYLLINQVRDGRVAAVHRADCALTCAVLAVLRAGNLRGYGAIKAGAAADPAPAVRHRQAGVVDSPRCVSLRCAWVQPCRLLCRLLRTASSRRAVDAVDSEVVAVESSASPAATVTNSAVLSMGVTANAARRKAEHDKVSLLT